MCSGRLLSGLKDPDPPFSSLLWISRFSSFPHRQLEHRQLLLTFVASAWSATHRSGMQNFCVDSKTFVLASQPSQFIRWASPVAIFSNINRVVRLHLDRVYFMTFAQLAQITWLFRCLNTLIITRFKWSPDPPRPTISPPQSLRK